MKNSISIDFTVCASKEAKICLNCPKKKCTPGKCKRFETLKRKERENNEKTP